MTRLLLSPRAQRIFLVASGVPLFVLGVIALRHARADVSHEVRVHHWPARLEGARIPLRAVAFDRTRKRLTPVAACAEEGGAFAASGGVALPLDTTVEAPGGADSVEACLRVPGWTARRLRVALPVADLEVRPPVWAAVDITSDDRAPTLPLEHVVVPQTGRYSSHGAGSDLLIWVAGEGALRLRQGPGPPQALEPSAADGLAIAAVRPGPLGAQPILEVERPPQIYQRQLRFAPRAAPIEIAATWSDGALSARVVASDADQLRDIRCVAMVGRAAVALDAPKPLDPADRAGRVRFDVPAAAWTEAGQVPWVQCDRLPPGGGPSSATAVATPAPGAQLPTAWRAALASGLAEVFGDAMGARVEGWLDSPQEAERRRAVRLIAAALRPQPIRPQVAASSLPADDAALDATWRRSRATLFTLLGGLLLLWLGVGVGSVMAQKRHRARAMAHFLASDPDGEGVDVQAAGLTGADPLARPRSMAVALTILSVLLLNIIGLLWVLWTLR